MKDRTMKIDDVHLDDGTLTVNYTLDDGTKMTQVVHAIPYVDTGLADAFETYVRKEMGLCPVLRCAGKVEIVASDMPIGGELYDVHVCTVCDWHEEVHA